MQRITKYLLLIIGMFIIILVNVDAKTFNPQEIQSNSYVIGTHIFTSNTELTMQKIMYASQSIDSQYLDDMIIYYKDPWGDWYDAISGDVLNIDKKFDIEYIDLEILPTTPEIEVYDYSYDSAELQDKTLNIDYYIDGEYGIEIYKSEEKNGPYSLIKKIEKESDYGYIETEIESGMQYYYAARTFKVIDGVVYYSDWSNIEKFNNVEVKFTSTSSYFFDEEDRTDSLWVKYYVDVSKNVDGIKAVYNIYDSEGKFVSQDETNYVKANLSLGINIWEIPRNNCAVMQIQPYKNIGGEKVYYDSVEPFEVCNKGLTLSTKSVDTNEENYVYHLKLSSTSDNIEILYRELGINSEFKVLKEVSNRNTVDIEVPLGKTYEIKARVKYGNSYGSFSNVVICYTEKIPKPTGEMVEIDYTDYLKVNLSSYVDAIEIYTSEIKDSSYKLAGTLYNEFFDFYEEYGLIIREGNSLFVSLEGLEDYSHMKIRFVLNLGKEEKYSDFSDIIEKENFEEFDYNYDHTDMNNNSIYSIYTYGNAQKFEVYYSEEDIEEKYELLGSFDSYETADLTIPQGKSYYVKVRTFNIYDNGKIYNEFMPTKLIENKNGFALSKEFVEQTELGYKYSLNVVGLEGYITFAEDERVEIMCSNTIDGEYTTIIDSENLFDAGQIEIATGETKYCKAKLYVINDNDEKIYGIDSNVVKLTSENSKPQIQSISISSLSFIVNTNDIDWPVSGLEIYGSNEIDGKYILLGEDNYNSKYKNWYADIDTSDITKYYKVRTYYYNGNEKVYSNYSDAFEYSISTPILALELNDDDTYNIIIQEELDYMNVEVYNCDSTGNNCKISTEGDRANILLDMPSKGKELYHKVRIYVGSGENKIYSDFSNLVMVNSPIESPVLEKIVGLKGEISLSVSGLNGSDGLEVYRSATIDGNYEKIDTISNEGNITIALELGNYYYKVRYYKEYETGFIYSDWSNIATVNEVIYNIGYDLNGGTASSNPTKYYNQNTFTLEQPSRKGYNFIGWTGSNGEIPEQEVTITKGTTGDLSYTANWEQKEYVVEFYLYDFLGYTVFEENECLYYRQYNSIKTKDGVLIANSNENGEVEMPSSDVLDAIGDEVILVLSDGTEVIAKVKFDN